MRLRPCAGVLVALALVSAACSGPTRGGGDAAPSPSTSLTTVPGSLHDTVPTQVDGSSASPPPTTTRPRAGSVRPTGTGTPTGDATTTTARTGSPTNSTSTTLPPGLPAEKCPEPKTCRRYNLIAGQVHRWRIGPDGRATIRYRINPSHADSTITPEQIEGAVAAAMETWQRAAPTLRFVYEGRTDKLAVQNDGVSVVSFNAPETARTWNTVDAEGNVTEFDIYFGRMGWVWAPCEQRDGSCTPYSTDRDSVSGIYAVDLQAVATHEVGHALWLADMVDNDLDRELTMYPGDAEDLQGSRHWTTLALGDVLGIRTLYPCSCPLPPIYDP